MPFVSLRDNALLTANLASLNPGWLAVYFEAASASGGVSSLRVSFNS